MQQRAAILADLDGGDLNVESVGFPASSFHASVDIDGKLHIPTHEARCMMEYRIAVYLLPIRWTYNT